MFSISIHGNSPLHKLVKMPCNCISQKAAKIILWISLPILAFSLVLIIVFPAIYNNILRKEISLEEGSLLSGIWEDIPLPIYEKVYFFNITNSEDFRAGNHPLNVTQVGPYTYKAKWVKKYPKWNENYTVSYKEKRIYHFVPEMSNGTEDDEIYTLNGPMIIASNIAKNWPWYERDGVTILFGIEGEHIVTKKKIRELAYEGYEDPIIKLAPIIKSNIPYKDGKFSWLYGKNDSDDGLFTVFTGVDDASKTNIINNWNGQEKLNLWKNDSCNMLNGTSIETGPPIKGHQDNYTFFQSIFCRSLTFNYTNDEIHYDILAKRFRPTDQLFANSTENPNNYCFEVNKERASGMLDISPCQFGAPVFISFPHFYMADKMYLNPVNGLDPNDEEHGSFLDVELITGISIYASIKFQVNLEITRVPHILQLDGVTEGIFPVFWVDLNLYINEDLANFLKSKLRNPKIIAYSVLGILGGVSFILVIISIVVLLTSKKDDDEPLLDAGDCTKPPYKRAHVNKVDSKNIQDEKSTEGHSYKE